jgi:hypothetical protein
MAFFFKSPDANSLRGAAETLSQKESNRVAVIRPKTEYCLRTKNEDCNKTKTSTGIGPKKIRGAVTRPKNITGTGIGPKKPVTRPKNITGTGIRPKNITGTGIRPKNIIIALGDNNLRPKGLKSGVSVDDVIRWHQNVVQLVTSIERLSLDPVFIYNCQNNQNVITGAL